jgi:hypothetical protein
MKTKLLSLTFAVMMVAAMVGGAVAYGALSPGTADAAADTPAPVVTDVANADESGGSDYEKDCPLGGH